MPSDPPSNRKRRASRRWHSFCHAGTSRVKLPHDPTVAASTPPLGQTSMADVFVSYARSDKARVAPLVAAIEAPGWSVWWDPEIDPAQEFDRLIAAQLKAAAAVLVVWTPDSVTSRWVRGEAREGAERGILVPVRFEHADLPIDVRTL